MFKRVLIANRGEIAVRIIRTLRDMGIESVALYSEPDKNSLHCALADFAYPLPGSAASETYLNMDAIVEAMLASGADALHPGYGFLSENALFQQKITNTGKVFIGPPQEALNLLGDKIQARQLAIRHGVPVVPGVERGLTSLEHLQEVSQDIGFPLILKASAGGGGRGMRIVRETSELAPAFEACRREAAAYFGNPEIFCERFVTNPRHIEIQVLFDQHGGGIHLFERDCSIQRRHQKLFEEAPSCYLNQEQREKLGGLAVKIARAANYVGAGTVEFICESPDKAYFMEMNPRIQVEHPVTEAITGLDLVREQIRVAAGLRLEQEQKNLRIHGWSMEARINAEDPAAGFLPTPGVVSECTLPSGPQVRVDTHLYPGYRIPGDYDSLLAKIIVWAPDREQARQRMLRCLGELSIRGVKTTVAFQEALLRHPLFADGDFNTGFYEEQSAYFATELKEANSGSSDHLAMVAALSWQKHRQDQQASAAFPRFTRWTPLKQGLRAPLDTSSAKTEGSHG